MAVIAHLDIILGAKTENAAKGLKGFSAEIASLRRTVVGIAGAYLSFAAAQRVVNGLFTRAESIDAMGKQADVLKESVERLEAMKLAGQLAGSSQEDLTAATLRLSKVLGEAAAGGQAQANAFKAIGLNVQQLLAMSPAERLFAVGGALGQQANSASLAKSATDLLGKSWGAIFSTISGGLPNLKASADQLRKLGYNFSRQDIAVIEEANDQLTLFRKSVEYMHLKALPAFAATLNAGLRALRGVREMFARLGAIDVPTSTLRILAWIAATVAITTIASKIIGALAKIRAAFLALAQAQTIALALSGPRGWLVLLGAAAAATAAFAAMDVATDGVNEELERMQAEAAAAGKEAQAAFDNVGDGADAAAEGVADQAKAAAEAMTEAARRAQDLRKAMFDKGLDLKKSLRTPLEEFRDDLAELQELAKFSAISGETASRAVDASLKRLRDSLDSSGAGELLNLGSAVRGSADALTPFLQRRAPDPMQAKMLKAEEEAVEALERIEDQLRRNPPLLIHFVGV